jgi:hypothetical protein
MIFRQLVLNPCGGEPAKMEFSNILFICEDSKPLVLVLERAVVAKTRSSLQRVLFQRFGDKSGYPQKKFRPFASIAK